MVKRSLDDVLADVMAIAYEYYDLTGKPLGATGEIAECRASSLLDLELAPPRTSGYDALRGTGKKAKKIQIKGRWKEDGKKWGRVSSINIKKEFDSVMLVLMHGKYEVLEIWEASRKSVVDRLEEGKAEGKSKARNERGSMGVSQFKKIAKKVWPAA